MKQKAFLCVLFAMCALAATYGAAAFITWAWSPGTWEPITRAVVVYVGALFAGVAGVMGALIDDL